MDSSVISLMVFIVLSLLVGVILKLIMKRSFVPYTVALFILGIAFGVCFRFDVIHIPHYMDLALDSVGNMDPEIILYFFLPILIFEAALNLNIHTFKKTFVNANILAIPGLVIALLLTGALVMLISHFYPDYAHWSWTAAFMFGALISATDPVAVVALLEELKTSKKFSTLVDSESMLNDGTGILFFMLFFGHFSKGGLPFSPVVNFIIIIFGAVAAGGITGALSMWLARRSKADAVLQSTVMIIAAYILFYVANSVFQVSGVIALVTFGLYVAYKGTTQLRPKVNTFIRNFWELMGYIANTLIFIIVGLLIALKCDIYWRDLGILFMVYVGVNIIRFIMVFFFLPIMRKINYGLKAREAVVLSWSGLRGAVGLTLALVAFYTPTIPIEIRHQILFLTGGIVTLTLLINATTMGWLLKKMRMMPKSSSKELLEYNMKMIYQQRAQSAFDELKKGDFMDNVDWDKLQSYLPEVSSIPVNHDTLPLESVIATIRRRLMQQQLSCCSTLFQEGIISPFARNNISDLIEELDDSDGKLPFTEMQKYFSTFGIKTSLQTKLMKSNKYFTNFFQNKIIDDYDFLRAFILVQRDSLKTAADLKLSPELKEDEIKSIDNIIIEINNNIEAAERQFLILETNFPIAFRMAVNKKAKRMLLSKERQVLREMAVSGMLTDEEETNMLDEVGKKNQVITETKT